MEIKFFEWIKEIAERYTRGIHIKEVHPKLEIHKRRLVQYLIQLGLKTHVTIKSNGAITSTLSERIYEIRLLIKQIVYINFVGLTIIHKFKNSTQNLL